ncbi:sugar kinase [Pigmentiphaga litoralis]|jgi:rfaE bifunctional protein kinase chain/domain|uniref:D-glycero-beta-D-manno-heptose-7-phosphate kinase n=1 Tax=Pigmentiphaga litoralis TaxID=516702 RepID=UPI0016789F5E|nr:D-glycero-beta-D-manno-heptose-7-phosphate kinase [Pigmentiphaga litoralis]GGX34792.1 sugar kinase [Pigmentiphaga litoralis]
MSDTKAAPGQPFPSDAVRQSARVLVIGDVMLDRYWFGEVDRISPEAPVPVVRVSRSEDRLGGAANVARNVAVLGARVTLVGIVGNDDSGVAISRLCAEAGVTAELVTDAAIPTTMKMRVLGRQQQLLRVDFEQSPGPDTLVALAERVASLMSDHDVVVLSDYAKGVLEHVEPLIALARRHECIILVDPKGDDYSRYRGATLVTPNQSEMRDAVGRWRDDDELAERAQRLRVALDLKALLVTRSELGMTLYTADGRDHVGAQAREVFDVSGAGDTVIATLAVMQAAGLDLHDAMRWANLAGGIVVGKLGTSIVTPAELSAAQAG